MPGPNPPGPPGPKPGGPPGPPNPPGPCGPKPGGLPGPPSRGGPSLRKSWGPAKAVLRPGKLPCPQRPSEIAAAPIAAEDARTTSGRPFANRFESEWESRRIIMRVLPGRDRNRRHLRRFFTGSSRSSYATGSGQASIGSYRGPEAVFGLRPIFPNQENYDKNLS
ncbi:hypothetical protein GC170_19775 [bacterium]|nr:hypothetical protein [bacterium]